MDKSGIVTFDSVPNGDVINFGIGQPSPDLLPVRLIREAAADFLTHADPLELNYGERQGDQRFRASLAEFLTRHYGHPASPESLIVTAGNSQALDFVCSVFTKPGDIVVTGSNFGCGSSREQAASCLKYSGVGAVIAKSFARIYFRNVINAGIPAIQCPEAVDAIADGAPVEVDLEKGTVACGGKTYTFPPLPEGVLAILRDGGLIPHARKALDKEDPS